MAGSIEDEAQQLSKAVTVLLDPYVDHKTRHEAHVLCEEFKEKSANSAHCGLYLADKRHNDIVRHFGLQLIEHAIRYRWNDLKPEEKMFIKNSSMQLLSNGTFDILTEHTHIKDALSRIVVEMIKREWPQQWPEMFAELSELCTMGAVQTELVLLILLRLAEDIVAFQNVQNKRRREIHQALSANMNNIFSFFLEKLKENVDIYRSLHNSEDNETKQKSMSHCRVAQSVLVCLSGFLDWISIAIIMSNDGVLLQLLCQLLSDQNLQMYAAECLLQYVSRKGKMEEREPILLLFNENILNLIFEAASTAARAPVEEHHYLFLKKLCLVITGLGSQLSALWRTEESCHRPSNFAKYLECLLAFADHPSQTICKYTQVLWISFLRHNIISKDPDLMSVIEKVVSCAAAKLVKVGLPSHSDSLSCEYSQLDFDSDEEFNTFFHTLRFCLMETIRLATVLTPMTTFKFASYWLKAELNKPAISNEGSKSNMCTSVSPSFLQWEATSVFLECVTCKISLANEPRPSVEDGIALLKAVIEFETPDPLILSCTLSCISALFVFLTEDPRMLRNVLDKPCFDQVYTHVKNLSQDPNQLSRMEKCTLVEALVLISNQFKDFNKQSSFLQEVLEPVCQTWLCNDMQQAFNNGQSFISFIGLNKEPVEPSNSDQVGMNRSQIQFCIDMLLAVLKRSSWPADLEEGKVGGFVLQCEEAYILHNPTESHILPLFENVFNLVCAFNQLWLPEVCNQICPQFKKAYEMPEWDRNNILGITNPPSNDPTFLTKSPIDRMQNFLTTVHDNCYHLLGNAGPCLGHAFYSIPRLAEIIISKVFSNLDAIPDYRLRPIMRVFIKPLIQHCPVEFFGPVILPVLSHICPYMFQKMNNKWLILTQQAEINNKSDEENAETQELVDEQLTRQITKEFIDILIAVMLKRGRNVEEVSDQMEAEDMIEHKPTPQHEDVLSELGLLVMKTKDVLPSILYCIFNGLSWNDTVACAKCSQVCGPALRHLMEENMISSDEACQLLTCILYGLQKHGQHDANQALLLNLGLSAYEAIRPKFAEITNVMLMIPNSQKSDIVNLDDKILHETPSKLAPEKKKKEIFKKIVVEIIGKNVGQIFKKQSKILDLPPIPRPEKKNKIENLLNSENLSLCSLFGDNLE